MLPGAEEADVMSNDKSEGLFPGCRFCMIILGKDADVQPVKGNPVHVHYCTTIVDKDCSDIEADESEHLTRSGSKL
jgi:hypothetical protein